jgi:hypothetical protein
MFSRGPWLVPSTHTGELLEAAVFIVNASIEPINFSSREFFFGAPEERNRLIEFLVRETS